MKKRSIALVILDGLGDLPIKALGGKTPLEVARTPVLDWFASRSSCGTLWPIKGIAPESGAAQFVMLGYPVSLYTGRGPFEAFGSGLKIEKGYVYFRCNFARMKGKKIVNVRERIPSPRLMRRINAIGRDIRIFPTLVYRGIMRVRGISTNVSNTHPGYVRYKNYSKAVTREMIERDCKGDKKSCEKINRFLDSVEEILKKKTILIRGAGNKLPRVKKLKNWCFIGDMPVEHGLAKLTGMRIVRRGRNEVKQLVKLLREGKNVYVQIKATDIPSHVGDFRGKVRAIKEVDRMLRPLMKVKDVVICITADHSTPCALKRHSADPVPCFIYGKRKTDKVMKFYERECKKGFRLEGKNLMKKLI